ncbi:dendritic cell-specific transmembrane protein [Poeciliopsis prolifica]|uniref:dendritic cell-specific transmembrane protein n=1 Tax=Poeciliopsis prolifica TaxID=188132 RepID=UPI00241322A0|nr:dendritic cell-specific transmembrane protein [Poeciliopsis prolifica]
MMLLSWSSARQHLEDTASQALDVFTTGERTTWRKTVLLLLTCVTSSLLLGSLLLLYLLFVVDYEAEVASGVAGCFGVSLTVALFLSNRVRCLGTLFVVSVFMKKSRNLLLTAGTSLVVLKNIRNTLRNLTRLTRSMICNLRAKKESVVAPFSNYVKMLEWIGGVLKGVTDLGVVNLDSKLKVSPRVESEVFRLKLREAEQRLNETARFVQGVMETVSSVTDKVFPAVSFLVLLAFIALRVRRYCGDVTYENSFISGRFVEFDEKQKAGGKPHVLPLTAEEERRYAAIPSARPTSSEGKAVLRFGAPVFSHFVAWALFITVDALLYCFVDTVTKKLAELKPFRVPLIISFKGIATLIGIQIEEDERQMDFSYDVTLFERKCLPEPELLLHNSVLPLSAILIALIFMALMASKVSQLRLMVCDRFFSDASNARVEFLHRKILRKRLQTSKREKNESSIMSFILKLHFWCPMFFRPKDERQSMA